MDRMHAEKDRLVGRFGMRLDRWVPQWAREWALAVLSGLLAFAATSGGLFIVTPWAQSALVAGIAVGLSAGRYRIAALAGALSGLLGVLLGPENFYSFYFAWLPETEAATAVAATALCAAVAFGVLFARERSALARPGFMALALVILLGNLWFTPMRMNAVSSSSSAGVALPPLNEQLRGNVPEVLGHTDGVLFLNVYRAMDDGADFYEEYARQLNAVPDRPIRSVADFRFPALFWVWTWLSDPVHIVTAFLVLATVAALSLVPLAASASRMELALPGVAALASYAVYFTLNTELLRPTVWAGFIGVIALAAHGVSLRSHRWKAWTIAAAALTVAALLTRETTAFLLLAGVVSAFRGDRSQRRFRADAWLVASVSFAALYGAHMAAAQPYIVSLGEIPRAGKGGIEFMVAALDYATHMLGGRGWLAFTLAGLGLLGAAFVHDPRLRIFALIATLAPLGSFIVLGNNAFALRAGGGVLYVNYWGAAVVPLLYALVPVALGLVPAQKPLYDAGNRRSALAEINDAA